MHMIRFDDYWTPRGSETFFWIRLVFSQVGGTRQRHTQRQRQEQKVEHLNNIKI